MQLTELIQRLSKLHEIHGDVAVLDELELPVVDVAFMPSGEFTDAPFIEIEHGEYE